MGRGTKSGNMSGLECFRLRSACGLEDRPPWRWKAVEDRRRGGRGERPADRWALHRTLAAHWSGLEADRGRRQCCPLTDEANWRGRARGSVSPVTGWQSLRRTPSERVDWAQWRSPPGACWPLQQPCPVDRATAAASPPPVAVLPSCCSALFQSPTWSPRWPTCRPWRRSWRPVRGAPVPAPAVSCTTSRDSCTASASQCRSWALLQTNANNANWSNVVQSSDDLLSF